MAGAIALLVISCGALAAGWGHVKTARRMRGFATTRGTVIGRELATLTGGEREGRWGTGGGYRPQVIYTYEVDGETFTSNRWSYAARGFKKRIAEQQLAAVPDEVDVHYDPAAPHEAYLQTNTPTVGYLLLAGGVLGVLIGLTLLV
jgi:hypothetical protein